MKGCQVATFFFAFYFLSINLDEIIEMKPTFCIIFLAISSLSRVFCQVESPDFDLFENAKFHNFTIDNGLPTDFCLKTCQSEDGIIWIATMHGIAKFNGFKWEYFQQESTEKNKQIGSNWVMDIFPRHKKIWYHSDKDIGFIQTNKNKIVKVNSLENGWGKVLPFKNGVLASTWKGIIHYSNAGNIKKITNDSFDECKYMFSLQNNIYSINTYSDGYFKYNNFYKKFIAVQKLKNSKGEKCQFKFLHAQAMGNKIIALTEKNGVLLIDPIQEKFSTIVPYSLIKNYAPNFVTPYFYKKTKYLLFGTESNGLIVVNLKNSKITQCIPTPEINEQTIASKKIHHIMCDAKNGVWISTDKGLTYFSPYNQIAKNKYFYQNALIPKDVIITSLKQVNKKELFIGTNKNGAFSLNTQTNETKRIPIPIHEKVNHIHQHNSFTYFIATTNFIYQYNSKNNSIVKLSAQAQKFIKIRKINEETIGVSSEIGASFINIKNGKIIFSEQHKKDEFNNSNLYTVDFIQDKKGDLWVLRKYDGLFKFNYITKNYTKITPNKYVKNGIDFHSMSYDASTNKVIVSSSSGIFIHDIKENGKLTVLNSKNGLAGEFINYAEISQNKYIYYTTINGLFKYNLNDHKSSTFLKFGQYENKENPTFDLYNQKILLPISNYFIQYDLYFPKDENLERPKLNSIQIGGKKISTRKKRLTVDYSNRHIEFQFNTEYFIRNNTVVLEYQLNNLNNKWTEITNGSIDFFGLESNTYLFKVRWRNLASNKVSSLLSKEIKINIPFYLSWWFYLFLTSVISIFLLLLYRFQLKAKEEILATRLQISRDLHDELGANVSSITIMSHLIGEAIPEKSIQFSYIQQLKENTSKINETINDIIWNVNPRFDKINDIILRIKRFASPLFESSKIIVKYNIQLIDENTIIPQKIKYNLYLLIKESINNCAKYSKATEVSITFIDSGKECYYEITDNGIGFDFDTKKELGNGLSNMISRSKSIKSKLEIESAPLKGTTIKLKIK